jgi:CTP synthase (UTP-ammonia lyase)
VELQPGEIFLQQLSFCSPEMHTISFKPLAGTLVARVYGDVEDVDELSHCYYGIKDEMITTFEENGFIVSGRSGDGEPKIMEYNKNRFFVITLYLPQLKPNSAQTHPLLSAFCSSVVNTVPAFS